MKISDLFLNSNKRQSNHDYANNEKIDMVTKITVSIEDLKYDSETKKLNYQIIQITKKPKISRYITRNYVRVPIYEEYSYRNKKICQFNKIINPFLFVNEQLDKLDISKNIKIKIIKKIGLVPKWREKEIEKERITDGILTMKKGIRVFNGEKKVYEFRETNLKDISNGFWWRLLFAIPTLFLSFIGYCTKKQVKINIIINENNSKWNREHKIAVNSSNSKLEQQIINSNRRIEKRIEISKRELDDHINSKIDLNLYEDDKWINLRRAINIDNSHLKNEKGVYIIYNKNKSKFYVGQSKNLHARIFSQHFNKGDVKNIIFAKDWFNEDEFFYRYISCETKDELDRIEKKYIEEYNSFKSGYNKTGGNV